MGEIRQYVFSVICVGTLCGVMQLLVTGVGRSSANFVTGLIVTMVAIAPLLRGEFNMNINMDQFAENRHMTILDGQSVAEKTFRAHIKEYTETYILDKAEALGAEISVDVQLDPDTLSVPIAVIVTGAVSPYKKQQLVECLARDLGIDKEQQRWIS